MTWSRNPAYHAPFVVFKSPATNRRCDCRTERKVILRHNFPTTVLNRLDALRVAATKYVSFPRALQRRPKVA